MKSIEDLKRVLREKDFPYFGDEDLTAYLAENGGDYDATAYQCLLIKAEATTMTLPGLSLPDTSKYFRRLALRHRPVNSGTLGGMR